MPARRRREGMHGGRRPKSHEGGTRGEVGTGDGVGYGDLAPVFDAIFHFGTGRAVERVRRAWVLSTAGCNPNGDVALSDLRFGGGKEAWTLAVDRALASPVRCRRRSGAVAGDGDRSGLVTSCRGGLMAWGSAWAGSRVRKSR